MARRQVDAEIKADPVTIILTRKPKLADGAGGWTWGTEVPQPPLTVRITPAKRRLSDMLQNTEIGDIVRSPYVVLGYHDANIQRDDTFQWNGDTFVVKSTEVKNEVQTLAQVDYLGGTHNA